MKSMIEALAKAGRGGDTEIGHLTKDEIVLPVPVQRANPDLMQRVREALTDAGVDWRRFQVGGDDDSRNPKTGIREYEFGSNADRGYSDTSDPSSGGFGGDTGRDSNDARNSGWDGGWNTGGGFVGSPEIGPAHAQDVTAAFNGDPGAMARTGNGPTDTGIGGFGVSLATNYNPMTNRTVYGLGFNPGRLAGGLIGNALGTAIGLPGVGGYIGSHLGGKMADTSFGFADTSGYGFGLSEPDRAVRDGGRSMAEVLMRHGV